jgi:opacity protein-like surface antigen
LLYYDLMTDWHNASAAPYKGYQNYVDRSDVNGGLDLGYKLTSDLAATLGYRYGHQNQQAFPSAINPATYQSSSDYQRVLLGLEGKPWKWLNVKLAGGPDFRAYNATAPVDDLHLTTYYGEALMTATLTTNQTVTVAYKQWQWVSSIGRVPYFDSSYALTYHWNATRQLGFDLGGKFVEADYNSASPAKTANGCRRDDGVYTVSAGVSYAFTSRFSVNLAYAHDFGLNLEENLSTTGNPSAAATAGYRDFDRQLVTLAAQYKF